MSEIERIVRDGFEQGIPLDQIIVQLEEVFSRDRSAIQSAFRTALTMITAIHDAYIENKDNI